MLYRIVALALGMLLLTGCSGELAAEGPSKAWEAVVDSARTTEVSLVSSVGERGERWMAGGLTAQVAADHEITLTLRGASVDEAHSELIVDRDAEQREGAYDLMIVDGPTAEEMLRQELLYKDFLSKLPKYQENCHPKDPLFARVGNLENPGAIVPINRRLFYMVYDEERTYEPPASYSALFDLLPENRGQFLLPDPMDPVGRHFYLGYLQGTLGTDAIEKAHGEGRLASLVEPRLGTLRALVPMLHPAAEAGFADMATIDRLFRSGEVLFTYATAIDRVDEMVGEDLYPMEARAFVLSEGTTGEALYAVIPMNSTNKSGAMVVIDTLLTGTMQAEMLQPRNWGQLPVIDSDVALGEEYQPIKRVRIGRGAPDVEDLLGIALDPLNRNTEEALLRLVAEGLGDAE